ncbi:MAG: hypothetical protein LBM16_05870, partial [Clostridiales bacterium]|nr:hypothetical protein [Clostridiales bacterium]
MKRSFLAVFLAFCLLFGSIANVPIAWANEAIGIVDIASSENDETLQDDEQNEKETIQTQPAILGAEDVIPVIKNIRSPIIGKDGSVTFNLSESAMENTSNNVYVVGNLNEWDATGGTYPLVSNSNGIRSVTIPAEQIPVGVKQEYKFVEGLSWDAPDYQDPSNINSNGDNSEFTIPESAVAVAGNNVTFYYRGNADTNNVTVSGSFTAEPITLQFLQGLFTATVPINAQGNYTYKFTADNVDDGTGTFDIKSDFSVTSPVVNRDGSVTFNLQKELASDVYVVGGFGGENNWALNRENLNMEQVDGVYTVTVPLGSGTWQYKFVEGTIWDDPNYTDPLNPNTADGNSVVTVPASPVVNDDFSVTFNLIADPSKPDAEVYVVGEFNGWAENNADYKLHKEGNVWTITVPPLAIGSYEYRFKEDGTWLSDLLNPSQKGDNSTFTVAPAIVSPVINDDGTATFNYGGDEGLSVFLVGDMNGWNTTETPMTYSNGVYSVTIPIEQIVYEYKFFVNGGYIADPANSFINEENGNSLLNNAPLASPVVNAEESTITFNYKGVGTNVFVAGEINGWSSDATPMTLTNGVFSAKV